MKITILMSMFLLTSMPQAGPAVPQAFGTIQGTVTREGTSDPIPGVQITVNGRGKSFADLMGVNNPQQAQAMAQSLLESAAHGAALPPEFMEAIQEAARGDAADTRKASAPLAAVSDAAGHFTIKDVPEGNAVLRAELKGFFAPAVNGSYSNAVTMHATVTARQTTDVRVPMIPGATISGRILDSSGKPVSDMPVQVLRSGYEKGARVLQFVDSKITDDRGEYRASRLPPGAYYVAANPRSPVANGSRASASPDPHLVPVQTLYPNAIEETAAIPIVLHGGDDVSAINIQIRMATGAKLSGHVLSTLPAGPVSGQRGQARPAVASVILMQRDTLGFAEINGGGVIVLNGGGGITVKPEDGSFEITDVPPGSYDLFARLPVAAYTGWGTANPPARATTPWAFGRISVDVHGASVDNLNIVVRPGVDLKGRVLVDGKAAAGDLQISLQPDDSAANINDGPASSIFSQIGAYHPAIERDGSFTFPLLPEGQYRFQVAIGTASPPATLSETAYVADIRQGSVSVYDRGIAVGGEPPNSIDVILNTNGGSVEGTVLGSDERPASKMRVVLVPPPDRRMNLDLYRTVSSDAAGHFAITRIPPGQYLLFASQTIQLGAWQNAEFLAKYSGYGTRAILSDGVRTTSVIKAIPND